MTDYAQALGRRKLAGTILILLSTRLSEDWTFRYERSAGG
jgi:hypothetical protein